MADRYDRDLELRGPSITKRPPLRVNGLWAVRDKQGYTLGYCQSETAAKAVAVHSQHFTVEYMQGPFDVAPTVAPDEMMSEGRFKKILEEGHEA